MTVSFSSVMAMTLSRTDSLAEGTGKGGEPDGAVMARLLVHARLLAAAP